MTGKRSRLNLPAYGLAFFLSTLWGANPVAIKAGLRDAPPLRLGWMRFVLGGVVVLLWALTTRESLRVKRHEWRPLLTVGCLFSLQVGLLNIGQDRTTAGHAAVITITYTLWTAVLAHFFVPGDRLTLTRIFGAVVAYTGILVVFSSSLNGTGPYSLLGDILLSLSAVLLGARQIVLSQSAASGVSITKLLLAQAVLGIVSFSVTSALFEAEPTQWTFRLGVALFYQGVIIAGFSFLAQTWLLKHFLPSRVTTVFLTQPIIGVLMSWVVLGEPVGSELYWGAGLVMVGSYFAQRH